MNRYNQAISAGFIGGIVLIILAVLGFGFNVVIGWVPYLGGGLACLLGLLSILAMAGTGALAVSFARHSLHDIIDAVMVSLVAGAVAGAMDGIVQVAITLITPGGSIMGFISKDIMAVFCSPVTIVVFAIVVAIVAAVGGALYGILIARIT